MRLSLQSVLSWIGVLTAIAYCLGYLKTFYYYDTFGIGLQALELSPTDYLFESWFVLENVVFFILMAWLVVMSRHWFMWTLGILYALVPIAAHYSFLAPTGVVTHLLITFRHTILKFVPFSVLIVLWLLNRRRRAFLKTAENAIWPHGRMSLALFIIVTAAWSISTAKHFGSFEANLAMLSPDDYLARVELRMKSSGQPAGVNGSTDLYLVFANQHHLYIWNHSGFSFGTNGSAVNIVVVPTEGVETISMSKPHLVQRGSLFF